MFTKSGRDRERQQEPNIDGRETHLLVISSSLRDQGRGLSLQLRYVPWTRIELGTLQSEGPHSIH